MANLENFSLIAAITSLALGIIFSIICFVFKKPLIVAMSQNRTSSSAKQTFTTPGKIWVFIIGLALAFNSLTIISRAVETGHGPFSNMYEFSVAFSWGIVMMSLFFLWRYRIIVPGAIGAVLALGLLILANTLPSKVVPLVPALQQSVLLSVHVACAIIAYGALTVGFSSAVIYLITQRRDISWMRQPEILDNISYHAVIVGFPFLTLTIILGAIWANIAWGRPWSWDPKETASLVTWLIFAAYLHARVLRGWTGVRSALLLVLGFAAILFTFFGNYIFSGLHSYK